MRSWRWPAPPGSSSSSCARCRTGSATRAALRHALGTYRIPSTFLFLQLFAIATPLVTLARGLGGTRIPLPLAALALRVRRRHRRVDRPDPVVPAGAERGVHGGLPLRSRGVAAAFADRRRRGRRAPGHQLPGDRDLGAQDARPARAVPASSRPDMGAGTRCRAHLAVGRRRGARSRRPAAGGNLRGTPRGPIPRSIVCSRRRRRAPAARTSCFRCCARSSAPV